MAHAETTPTLYGLMAEFETPGALVAAAEQARLAGAEIILSGVQPQPRSMLDRVGLGETSPKVAHAADYMRAQSLAVDLLEKK